MNYLFNEKKMIISLGFTAVIMLTCIFVSLVTTPKILAVGMGLWFAHVAWIVYLLGRGKWSDIASSRRGGIMIPICIAGIIMIIINLIAIYIAA